ncbi:MAG: lytic transglycosylase domain-containing protein [Bdellovibrio sp.]|nr:lytic transglycosylase domain-containing protein [Bdellovibrio sp.]
MLNCNSRYAKPQFTFFLILLLFKNVFGQDIQTEDNFVKEIAKATTAIDNKNYEQARKTAQGINKSILFLDYSYFLLGEISFQEATKYLAKKTYHLQKALSYFHQMTYETPFSPLTKIANKKIAQIEFLIAQDYYAKRSFLTAYVFFEKALQQLYLQGDQSFTLLIPFSFYQQFLQTCSKINNEHIQSQCQAWLRKIFTLLPKNSTEHEILLKSEFDFLKTIKNPPTPSKITQSYKGKDQDLEMMGNIFQNFLKNNTEGTVSELEKFLGEFPKSSQRFRARFWLGKTLLQLKQEERAKIIFHNLATESPLSYYGLLAAYELKQLPGKFIVTTMPKTESTPEINTLYLQPSESFWIKRARLLIKGGLLDYAYFELSQIKARDALSNAFLIELANLSAETNNHKVCFQILSELFNRGAKELNSTFGLRLIFPFPYLDEIKKLALAEQVDPILVLSVIKQESAFNEDALSPSGAAGLMQLMPFTAIDMEPNIKQFDILNTEKNIKLGIAYLKKLIKKYKGNFVLALAAYNAGPAMIDRLLNQNKQDLLLSFIETIPYRETREYVTAILRNYYWYSHLLKGEYLSLNSEAKINDISIFFLPNHGP